MSVLKTKCNCCLHDSVCRYKDLYNRTADQLYKLHVDGVSGGIFNLKDADYISVNIRCTNFKGQSSLRQEVDPSD